MTDLVLGDNNSLFVEALAEVLAKHSLVVRAIARDISEVIDAVQKYQPDICLLERYFTDGDAVDVIGDIIRTSDRTRVVLLTADKSGDAAQRALRSGAQAYLHKSAGFGALVDAIGEIMTSNGGVVPRDVPRDDLRDVPRDVKVSGGADSAGAGVTSTGTGPDAGPGEPDLPTNVDLPGQRSAPPSTELADARRLAGYLTVRERECLELIVEGLGTDAMAKRLGVSNTTVRTHSQRLLTKLGVHSRLEAASFAVRYSLLEPPPQG